MEIDQLPSEIEKIRNEIADLKQQFSSNQLSTVNSYQSVATLHSTLYDTDLKKIAAQIDCFEERYIDLK